MKTEIKQKSGTPVIFVLFGATGDLAVKKIFPALETLHRNGVIDANSRIVAVSRREWNDAQFLSHAGVSGGKGGLAKLILYSRVDIDQGAGYGELFERVENLKKENAQAKVVVYLSLAPRYQVKVIESLVREKMLVRGGAKLLIEKPFGTDEESAKNLDKLLLSFLDERQIYRIDHYLGKDTVMALMRLHESTESFSLILSRENISQIRIRLFETAGVVGRGASYDHVGAFRDVGQNHMLTMLAALAAPVPKKSWQAARAEVLRRLSPPAKTCDLSRRGQYDGYKNEIGVRADSQTETAFEITTSLTGGKLSGVPLVLESGKKMPSAEVLMEIKFKKTGGLPEKILFKVQPEREIVIEYGGGKRDVFDIPGTNDAYANIIEAAILGRLHEFVGREEIEALWKYTDRVVACWGKVPLETYGHARPFLIK